MTMFEDWNVEYDPTAVAKARARKGEVALKAITIVGDLSPADKMNISERVRIGSDLSPDQLGKLIPSDSEKKVAKDAIDQYGQPVIDSKAWRELETFWLSAEAAVAANEIQTKLDDAETELGASIANIETYRQQQVVLEEDPTTIFLKPEGKAMSKAAASQRKIVDALITESEAAQTKRWNAEQSFAQAAGTPIVPKTAAPAAGGAAAALGPVWGRLVPGAKTPPSAADVFGAGFADFTKDFQVPEPEGPLEGPAGGTGAGGTGAGGTGAGGTGTGGPGTGVPNAAREAAIQAKWKAQGMVGVYLQRRAQGSTPDEIDAEFSRYQTAATAAQMQLHEWYAQNMLPGFDPTGAGGTGGGAPVGTGLTARTGFPDGTGLPGGTGQGPAAGFESGLEEALRQANLDVDAYTIPQLREETFARQSPGTVWGRMGLTGQLVRDPGELGQPGAAISTQQLSPFAQSAVEDVLYRDVMPGYGFAAAEAGRRQAENIPIQAGFVPSFEQFAQGAAGRERLTAEQFGQGQANVIAAIQRARGTETPGVWDAETLEWFSKGSTAENPLDDVKNTRLIGALFPFLSQISPSFRQGAMAQVQQRLLNQKAIQPEKTLIELATGSREQFPTGYLGNSVAGNNQPWIPTT